MLKKTLAITVKAFGGVGLSMWLYASFMYSSFRTYPTAPVPTEGKVVPFLWKTKNVYISESESWTYNALVYGAVALFAALIFLYLWAQKKFDDPLLFPQLQMREAPGRAQKLLLIAILILVVVGALYSYLGINQS